MRLSTPTFVIVLAMLLLGMVGLNVADRRFAPKSPEEEAAAQAAEAQKSEPAQPAASGSADLVRLPPEQITGAPNAHMEVVFGWEWTPEVQANPGQMYQAIEALQKAAAGNAHVKLRVVNVDLVPDAPRGLAVNGKTVLELPANGVIEPPRLMQSMSSVLSQHAH